METTNSSEHIPYVYNYQRNKTTVNQALAEDLILDERRYKYNENIKKKTKLIKNPNANMRDLDKKKAYELENQEDIKQINTFLVKTVCKPLLEKIYQELNKIKAPIEQKKQLEECKKNALLYIEKALQGNGNITNKRMRNICKVSRGETFLFSNQKGEIEYIFEIDKAAEEKEEISQIKKGNYFFRRHIEEDADLSKMIETLYKLKLFFKTYKPEIRYGISSSWLRDKKFLTYFEKRRQNNNISKDSKIVNTYKEGLKYIAKNGILENCPIEQNYEEFKTKFIDQNSTSSLVQALKEYEKEGNKLEEGGLVIDLNKVDLR